MHLPQRSKNRYFLGHWNLNFFPIFIYISFTISILCIIKFLAFPYITLISQKYWSRLILFFLLFCFYLRLSIIFVGPGYLPFYANKKSLIEENNPLSGLVYNIEQYKYVSSNPPKFDAIFSLREGRFILRADQYSYFLTTWIGKKNQKLFIYLQIIELFLFMSYLGPISQAIFIIPNLYAISYYYYYFIVFILILLLVFCIINIFIIFEQIRLVSLGLTTFQEQNHNYNTVRFSPLKNWQDICGKSIWNWFLPIPAFPFQSDMSLAYEMN